MLIIGIAGGTGSGKTTVVSKILQNLNANEVNVLSQDNYYHDNAHLSLQEREKLNYDHPKSIDFDLLVKHVQALKNGESIEQPIYSFVTHTRTGNHVLVEPREVLIVEGILVLTSKELLKEFDLRYLSMPIMMRGSSAVSAGIPKSGAEIWRKFYTATKPR